MLPPVPDLAAWRRLRGDASAQRPAIDAIATRHGLSASELRFVDRGTHLVWASDRHVLKLFVPLWPEDASVETTLLEVVAGTSLPAPQLEGRGEIDGWPYVVMSRVAGQPLGVAWSALDDAGRSRLATHLGETIAALASLPRQGLEARAVSQEGLLAERLERVVEDQRTRGGSDQLEDELRKYVADLSPPVPADEVVLHADLTDDNVLVTGDRVSGVIDFGDAFVGPWTYELAAPACFVTRGRPDLRDALIRGRGDEPTPELIATIRTWAILHRYGHVARMMQDAGAATLPAFLDLL